MTFRDRWLRRTDDARRTKGDPPPTYAQLMADIRQTQAALALAEQIAGNLRHQDPDPARPYIKSPEATT